MQTGAITKKKQKTVCYGSELLIDADVLRQVLLECGFRNGKIFPYVFIYFHLGHIVVI